MHSDHRQAKKKFANEIAVADRIETVLTDARKPELLRHYLAVEDDCRSSQRAGTERQNIRSCIAITDAFRVARKSFNLRQQIMREKNWLGTLQVRIARHDTIDMLSCEIEQSGLQRAKSGTQFCNLGFDVETQIERDLIIPAARGVKFPSGRANSLRQCRSNLPDSILASLSRIQFSILDRSVAVKNSAA